MEISTGVKLWIHKLIATAGKLSVHFEAVGTNIGTMLATYIPNQRILYIMSVKNLLAIALLVVNGVACVKENNHIEAIVFGKIVGQFDGDSQVCQHLVGSSDTICGDILTNSIKAIIVDSKTISISDVYGIYSNTNLGYQNTSNLPVGKTHHFFAENTNGSIVLTFNENNDSLFIQKSVLGDSGTTFEIYKGQK